MRPLVNCACDEFLSRSGLTGDQDSGFGRRDLRDAGQDRLESRRVSHNLLEHQGVVDLFAQCEVFFLDLFFRLLAVLDVDSRRVPANGPALRVAQGIVADKNQRYCPSLRRARCSFSNGMPRKKGPMALFAQPLDVIGMENPVA